MAVPSALPAARPLGGLDRIDPAAWDALVPAGSAPLRHASLRAWEHAELAGLAPRPLVLREPASERPLAAAPGYRYRLDVAAVQETLLSPLLGAVRRLAPQLLVARVFEVGSPAPLASPFLYADGVDRSEAAAMLVAATLEEAERSDAHVVVVQDFAADDDPAAEELRDTGFARVPLHPAFVVETPFDSFDAYLGAMRAHYRRRARRVLEGSRGLRAELLDDFGARAPELARLWRLVFERAEEYRREVLPTAFFRAAAELDGVRVLALRRPDGSIASYALLQDDEPWLHFLYCGFEERAGREEGAYFRLLYEIVRTAIEGGFGRVSLGMTTAEPKLDVGGTPVELAAWVRHRNPLLHRALARLAAGPFAPPAVEPRNVFKERARPRAQATVRAPI